MLYNVLSTPQGEGDTIPYGDERNTIYYMRTLYNIYMYYIICYILYTIYYIPYTILYSVLSTQRAEWTPYHMGGGVLYTIYYVLYTTSYVLYTIYHISSTTCDTRYAIYCILYTIYHPLGIVYFNT